MFDSGADEHLHDILLADDSVLSREPDETCAVEAADGDDDADEFVEWNEGDGN